MVGGTGETATTSFSSPPTLAAPIPFIPITMAAVWLAASLFCVHGGADYRCRYVVTDLCRQVRIRSCFVGGRKEFIISVLTVKTNENETS